MQDQLDKTPRKGLILLCLFVLLIPIMGMSLFVGSNPLASEIVWQAITHYDAADTNHLIVYELRIPRIDRSVWRRKPRIGGSSNAIFDPKRSG